MSGVSFPLEPLYTLRGLRLRALETELRCCRALLDQAEKNRLEASEALSLAQQLRQAFVESSWRQLFDQDGPNGVAMDRHERHLALLDDGIVERRAALALCEQASAEAGEVLNQALAAWRKARNKLDAVGEMKQEWQRDLRQVSERRDEQSLEELAVRQQPLDGGRHA